MRSHSAALQSAGQGRTCAPAAREWSHTVGNKWGNTNTPLQQAVHLRAIVSPGIYQMRWRRA
jgi:hypothetical protein